MCLQQTYTYLNFFSINLHFWHTFQPEASAFLPHPFYDTGIQCNSGQIFKIILLQTVCNKDETFHLTKSFFQCKQICGTTQ